MSVVGRSLFHSSLLRICEEIRSWYMSPFQIGLVRIFVRIFVMLLNRALGNRGSFGSFGSDPYH